MGLPANAPRSSRLADGTPFFGRLGQVACDLDEDRVQCHLCGEWFRQVGGSHLIGRHGWTTEAYREAFRLPKRVATSAPGLSEALGRRSRERPTPTVGRLKGDSAAARSTGSARRRAIPQIRRTLASTRPDLVAEWHPIRNAGLTPEALGMSSTDPVWWQCSSCGHEWCCSVNARKRSAGCPVCWRERQREQTRTRQRAAAERRMRAIALANPLAARERAEWHPTRNGDLEASHVSAKSHRRVWWCCAVCGHEWEAVVYSRTEGSGCPRCARSGWYKPSPGTVDRS